MRELFIYYQASTAHAAALEDAVHAMQQRLCATHPGLQARLLRRQACRFASGPPRGNEAPGGPTFPHEALTWMEIYTRPAGIDDTLQADIERAAEALAPWLGSPRHTEAFAPCA